MTTNNPHCHEVRERSRLPADNTVLTRLQTNLTVTRSERDPVFQQTIRFSHDYKQTTLSRGQRELPSSSRQYGSHMTTNNPHCHEVRERSRLPADNTVLTRLQTNLTVTRSERDPVFQQTIRFSHDYKQTTLSRGQREIPSSSRQYGSHTTTNKTHCHEVRERSRLPADNTVLTRLQTNHTVTRLERDPVFQQTIRFSHDYK